MDYDPIFAAERGPVAALIAVAGVLLGNGISYLISQYGYRTAKQAGRSILALFFFLLCIMNVGNLISYIPARTFATHADMATVEQGLGISPWWLAIVLGIPFCIAVAYFVLKTVPEAIRYFFPDSRVEQALLLALCCYMISGATRPSVLLNSDESWIDSALVEIQGVLRDLLKPVGDSIGMLRAHGGKGAEDHEVESALQNLEGHFLHLTFK